MLKINWRFLGFLLVVLFQTISSLCAAESSKPAASSQSAVSPAPSVATPEIDSALRAAQEEVRDPFAIAPETEAAVLTPPVSAVPTVTVVLQGIGFGSKDAYAIMGGDVYYIGDEKNGIKLLEVRRREVDILVNGGQITLPLFPGEELKKAKDRAEKKNAAKNVPAVLPSGKPSSSSEREQLPL
jgi:hypothetical protein